MPEISSTAHLVFRMLVTPLPRTQLHILWEMQNVQQRQQHLQHHLPCILPRKKIHLFPRARQPDHKAELGQAGGSNEGQGKAHEQKPLPGVAEELHSEDDEGKSPKEHRQGETWGWG